jgi:hypothetical protein
VTVESKPMRRFLQLDALIQLPGDPDGYLFAGIAEDPQSTPTVVRIRIDPRYEPALVRQMLRELLEWYERAGDDLWLTSLEEEPF